jgi:hypothetical protein
MISGARYHLVATSADKLLSPEYDARPETLTLGHEPSLSLIGLHRPRLESSRQSEVTNLQLAIRIHEQVSGLKISVQDIGRVDVLHISVCSYWVREPEVEAAWAAPGSKANVRVVGGTTATHLETAQRLVQE